MTIYCTVSALGTVRGQDDGYLVIDHVEGEDTERSLGLLPPSPAVSLVPADSHCNKQNRFIMYSLSPIIITTFWKHLAHWVNSIWQLSLLWR